MVKSFYYELLAYVSVRRGADGEVFRVNDCLKIVTEVVADCQKQLEFGVKLEPTSLTGPQARRGRDGSLGPFMFCNAVSTSAECGTAAPAKMYWCQGLPACSPRPL